MRGIASGQYDPLFQGAPDKPSELYKAAQNPPVAPTIRLVNSIPFAPQEFISPIYPPIAKLARVEGQVAFDAKIDSAGRAAVTTFESGSPLLRGAVQDAVQKWQFPSGAENQQLHAVIEFKTNCPSR
jgi:protein TonB